MSVLRGFRASCPSSVPGLSGQVGQGESRPALRFLPLSHLSHLNDLKSPRRRAFLALIEKNPGQPGQVGQAGKKPCRLYVFPVPPDQTQVGQSPR